MGAAEGAGKARRAGGVGSEGTRRGAGRGAGDGGEGE